MWPRKKACQHIRDRVRAVVRSFLSSASIRDVVRKLNPILNGWWPYFRVGNRTGSFTRSIGPCSASCNYGSDANINAVGGLLGSAGTISSGINAAVCLGGHQMVGRVSHLSRLRRTPTEEDGRRAGCGGNRKTARVQFDEGVQETCDCVTRLCPTLRSPG